jgi:hypothetical protein
VVIWNIYSKEGKIMLNGSEGNRVWTHELDWSFWQKGLKVSFFLLLLNPGVLSTWGSSGYLIRVAWIPHMLQEHGHYNCMA